MPQTLLNLYSLILTLPEHLYVWLWLVLDLLGFGYLTAPQCVGHFSTKVQVAVKILLSYEEYMRASRGFLHVLALETIWF